MTITLTREETQQIEALRLAERFENVQDWYEFDAQSWFPLAAIELRRLHEVNAVLIGILKRIHLEKGFACECNIGDATWELTEAVITKATGEQQ